MADVNENPGGAAPGWAAGLDADHQTFLQSKGWDKLEGPQAAVELAKAYRGSEKLRGGLAAGDVVALPKEGDAAAAKAFWERVGTPKDATGYTFDGLKRKDGTALDAGYLDAARLAASNANMPAHMLKAFVEGLQPHFDGQQESAAASRTADIEANRRALAHEWGANEGRNKFIASRAMDTLKDHLPLEAVSALEALPGVGFVGVHKLFLALGEMMGEARFVPGTVDGTIDAGQAQAALDAAMHDSAWNERWRNGGDKEAADKANWIKIITGGR